MANKPQSENPATAVSETETLFDPVTLNGQLLTNRIGLAPMTRVSATADGRPTDEMARYYSKFADGGFSFLLTEGTYTDDEYSQGYQNQPGLVTDEQVAAWERVTDAVHGSGARIFAQLMHAGAQSQGNRHVDGEKTLAPSRVRPSGSMLEAYGGSGEFPIPKAATRDNLDAVTDGFVSAAINAHDAGFDGVEIHAANGYLLNEFLATETNRRDDQYGGDSQSRVRYPAGVVSAVRNAVPDGFVVGVRVSQTTVLDDAYEWEEGRDAADVFFSAFVSAGVDYIHVTEPDITAPAFGAAGPTLAEIASEHANNGTLTVANGGLGRPEDARSAVETGVDLVTLGKSGLANPDWPRRVAVDEPLESFDPEKYLGPTARITASEIQPREDPTASDASSARRTILNPDPYEEFNIAQAYEHDGLLYVSGQTAIDQEGSIVGPEDFDAQAKQVFTNLQRVLRAGGSSLNQVLKVNIYLTDMDYFDRIVELREQYFSEPYPADTIVEIDSLALPEALLEIEAIALTDGGVIE